MSDVIIGMIGFGTVGTGVAKILLNDRGMLEQRAGCKVALKRIADLDVTTDRGVKIPKGLLVADVNAVLGDPEINTVIEVIGGENPAKKFIDAALEAGKNVITSNKEVIAKHGKHFTELAKAHDCTILYEASVGGGIPILQAIRSSLAANNIERIYGIVNGTTNYILSKMSASGADFSDTLKEAQALGYAEANPKNDVEGYDATYKLAILAGLAFRCTVDYNDIYREGITTITAEDFVAARQFGYAIKILAMGINHDGAIELRVHPVMVEISHPLANVNDVFNAIFIRGSSLGDAMLYGRGAGELPTASAVVGDVMNIAFKRGSGFDRDTEFAINERSVMSINDCVTKFFVRCTVEDTAGVLANLANVFAKNAVSIERLQQMDAKNGIATITVITHPVAESNMRAALHAAEGLPCMQKIASVIRVGFGGEA